MHGDDGGDGVEQGEDLLQALSGEVQAAGAGECLEAARPGLVRCAQAQDCQVGVGRVGHGLAVGGGGRRVHTLQVQAGTVGQRERAGLEQGQRAVLGGGAEAADTLWPSRSTAK